MGVIIDPEDENGFSVEVRRESFYIVATIDQQMFLYGDDVAEFSIDDIPHIREALDRVENYLKTRK